MAFGDYIVYVDESGDHGMKSIDRQYPVFVLAFCIIHKHSYTESIVPAHIELKFTYFGHDMVILHEREIRKREGEFRILNDPGIRSAFLGELTTFVSNADFTLVSVIIKKDEHAARYANPANPYEFAMKLGLERVQSFLKEKGQNGLTTSFIFESRGKNEDRDLELEFRRVCDGRNYRGEKYPFRLIMVSKKCNSCGLQLADLMARPIGQHILHPEVASRAYSALEGKFYKKNGQINGWGMKLFPK